MGKLEISVLIHTQISLLHAQISLSFARRYGSDNFEAEALHEKEGWFSVNYKGQDITCIIY